MSYNAVDLNENTFEPVENLFDINKTNIIDEVFEPETFEFNEADIGFDDSFESDEFNEFESENEESLDNNDEDDIIIEQNKTNNLTSCVIIDKIDGKIQKCKNIESFRTLWQLVGVWQINEKKILEVDGSLEK